MAGTVYAMNVTLTNGQSGFVKFYGDGTWDWHLVSDVDEANLYRSKQECIDDYYKHVKDGYLLESGGSVYVDHSRTRISECYCPWL
jgi:hypothetical protein